MALDNMISAVAAILATVTGIGNVHSYLRWNASDAGFKTLFVKSGKINAWEVTRESTPEAVDVAGGASLDGHQLIIHGYYGVDDSANTERTFQMLIEAIRAEFQTNRRLNPGTGNVAHDSDRMKVRLVDHRSFHGHLVHHCEILLYAREVINP